MEAVEREGVFMLTIALCISSWVSHGLVGVSQAVPSTLGILGPCLAIYPGWDGSPLLYPCGV